MKIEVSDGIKVANQMILKIERLSQVYLSGPIVITRVLRGGRGELKRDPERWQYKMDLNNIAGFEDGGRGTEAKKKKKSAGGFQKMEKAKKQIILQTQSLKRMCIPASTLILAQ